MTTEINPNTNEGKQVTVKYQGSSEAVYGLGLIGAWVYYFSKVTTLQEGVAAFFKGLFWPAFLVYKLLKFLDME